jgi:uncharacterized membrane protein
LSEPEDKTTVYYNTSGVVFQAALLSLLIKNLSFDLQCQAAVLYFKTAFVREFTQGEEKYDQR